MNYRQSLGLNALAVELADERRMNYATATLPTEANKLVGRECPSERDRLIELAQAWPADLVGLLLLLRLVRSAAPTDSELVYRALGHLQLD